MLQSRANKHSDEFSHHTHYEVAYVFSMSRSVFVTRTSVDSQAANAISELLQLIGESIKTITNQNGEMFTFK